MILIKNSFSFAFRADTRACFLSIPMIIAIDTDEMSVDQFFQLFLFFKERIKKFIPELT